MSNIENTLIQKESFKKAEFYLNKYLNEIARHFELKENDIIKILFNLAIKKKYTTKKWWQFFVKPL